MIGIGTRLAHYELTGHLGSGGMGDVYQARDLTLGRSVAVKVLPEALAADPDRIARFEREAKVLASLNHPNIASIYGLEEAGGRHLLVMELVEGDTLAAQIARGPIAVERALDLAQQIADALEAAHEKGVVHRDLKPANVKVTPDGKVKVLDFGLAKAMEMSPAAANISNSPTLTALATSAGVILGTAAYMSPEQARGENADARSDTFSFGCVLYEMLSGRQAFQGKTATDILASVLAREPDFMLLPPRLHPRLLQLLHRALEKEPRRRWQAIGDLRLEIDAIRSGGAFVETGTPPARALWKLALPIAGTAILASLLTGAAMWTLRSAVPVTVTRFFIPFPEAPSGGAISPDGSQIVYGGKGRLYLRPMDEPNGRPIPGTEHRGFLGASPDFSPDGKWIVFVDAGSLTDAIIKRIAPTGGTPVTLFEGTYPWGLNWGEGGIVFWSAGKGLLRIPTSGGEPELLLSDKRAGEYGRPELLPGGDAVIFTTGSGFGSELQVVVQPLKSGERKTLLERGGDVRYLPTGHLAYMRSGTLTAIAFDPQRLEVSGEQVPVVEGIQINGVTGIPQYDFSETGSLIFLPGPAFSRGYEASLATIDRKSVVTVLPVPNDAYVFPRISPDGKRIVFGIDRGLFVAGAAKEANIYVYDLAGSSAPRRLTLEGANRYPIWLGSEFVAFQSDREGDLGIFRQPADGVGAAERLTKPAKDETHIPDSWSPVGETFSYTAVKGGRGAVWTYSLRDSTATLFAEDPSSFLGRSVFSPDGQWLAYHQIQPDSQIPSVFVQAFPTGAKFLVSKGVAHSPAWSRDGRELFYIRAPAQLASLGITTTPGFSSGNPVPEAMPVADISPAAPRMYDVTPDGRFLTVLPVSTDEKDTPPGIQVVLNWFEDVKRRVGGN